MIQRATVDGRPATVVYVDKDFEPTTAEAAVMVKVIFDDGEVRFGYRDGGAPAGSNQGGVNL